MTTIFHDSDGCVAHFDGACERLGVHPSTIGDAKFWQIANATPHFWYEMPLMEGAKEYFEKIRHLDPTVLTGAPSGNFEAAAEAKRWWWKQHFNYDRVEVVLSKHKHLHITKPTDVLVDDTYRLVKKWRLHGGTAILFKSHEQALEELRQLGHL